MSEVALTQNKVVAMAREIDPSKTWVVDHVETEKLEKQAVEASKIPDPPLITMVGSVFRMYFGGPEFGNMFALWLLIWLMHTIGMPFKNTDNALLGITELTDEELKKVIEGVMFG